MLSDAQTELGFAIEEEATAGETARQTAAENDQLESDLIKTMKTCSDDYIDYETELCALEEIRGDLYETEAMIAQVSSEIVRSASGIQRSARRHATGRMKRKGNRS